jgi:hypothetical protein
MRVRLPPLGDLARTLPGEDFRPFVLDRGRHDVVKRNASKRVHSVI